MIKHRIYTPNGKCVEVAAGENSVYDDKTCLLIFSDEDGDPIGFLFENGAVVIESQYDYTQPVDSPPTL